MNPFPIILAAFVVAYLLWPIMAWFEVRRPGRALPGDGPLTRMRHASYRIRKRYQMRARRAAHKHALPSHW